MITLKEATFLDVEAIAMLLAEVDKFYGASEIEPAEARATAVRDALFSDSLAARVLLAWKDGHLVGFAAYSFLWPAAGTTRSLYLKELYVLESCRNEGVGRRLMRHLGMIARDTGCSRVEWTADSDNVGAQRFYAALGVSPNPDKLFYRIEGDVLRSLASEPETSG